jgi:hypothetical protein
VKHVTRPERLLIGVIDRDSIRSIASSAYGARLSIDMATRTGELTVTLSRRNASMQVDGLAFCRGIRPILMLRVAIQPPAPTFHLIHREP